MHAICRRIYSILPTVLLVVGAIPPLEAVGQELDDRGQLEIVYLGNEGFLLHTKESAALVDALFGEGLFGYDTVEEGVRRELEAARPPFDNVDLAVASHVHGDHFSAPPVARFLLASPGTEFVSTEQTVRKLLGYEPAVADRARGVAPAEGRQVRHSAGAIELTAFNLHHGEGEIQNLGLLIEICGLTVLHIGDTETSPDEMRTAGLQSLRPDVVLLPAWYLRPGRWQAAVDEVIQPRRVVAMHLPTSDAPPAYFWGGLDSREKLVRAIVERHEGAFVPRKTGDAITIDCRRSD